MSGGGLRVTSAGRTVVTKAYTISPPNSQDGIAYSSRRMPAMTSVNTSVGSIGTATLSASRTGSFSAARRCSATASSRTGTAAITMTSPASSASSEKSSRRSSMPA